VRRRRQQDFLSKHLSKNEQSMFWDGFQWVSRVSTGNTTEHNATRKNRRLYVANIPFDSAVTEDQLAQKIIQIMRDKKLLSVDSPSSPVLHVWFSKDRKMNYGFVEMTTIEDTENALNHLDGMVFAGNILTIRRPNESSLPLLPTTQQPQQQLPSSYVPSALLSVETLRPLLQQTAQPLPASSHFAPLPPAASMNATSSCILKLSRALFWASENTANDEFLDAIDDIMHGIRRFSGIAPKNVLVARHEISDPLVLSVGDVLIELANISEAVNVYEKLKNRKYDGKLLSICSVDEALWRSRLRSVLLEMNVSSAY
jgi:hypothetical protein